MKTDFLKKGLLIFSFLFLISFNFALADNSFKYGLDKVDPSYFGNASVPTVIGRVIQVLMGLSATVMLIIVIWAGIQYLLSRGDPGKTKKALDLIKSAIVGIIIIVSAYSMSQFIINNIKFIAS